MTDINYISSQSIGKIYEFKANKTAQISPIPFPGRDAYATEGVDSLGMIGLYDIAGVFVGGFSAIQTFIQNIRDVADGKQDTAQALRSPFVNSKIGISDGTYGEATSLYPTPVVDVDNPRYAKGFLGENDDVTANQLIDWQAYFKTWGIKKYTGIDDISDKVKNLISGEVTTISSLTNTVLTLEDDIFPNNNTPYALTATIKVKILSFEYVWRIPAINYCWYTMQLIQVKG